MTETLRFDPIYPAHAIERCSATLNFGEPITDKLLQKVRAKANILFAQLQMVAQTQPQMGFEIDPQSGAVTPMSVGLGSVTYMNSDRSLSCIITPGAIIWNNSRYVRWQPFIGQVERVLPVLVSIINDAVDIVSIKLEYLDRFYWTGDWSRFDSAKILRSDRGFWAETAKKADREWHAHTGWFEKIANNSRRLVNVNIDVVGAVRPGGGDAVPSIGILTLLQDQMLRADGGSQAGDQNGFTDLISVLDMQHLALKDMLAEVIVPEMADRITLNPQSR